MRAVAWIVLAALLPACKLELQLIPELPDEMASAIVLIASSQNTRAYASDPAMPANVLSDDQSELSVIVSAQRKTLAELGLEPGELPVGTEGSVLPHADLLLRASVSGSSAGAFEVIAALPAPLDELRLGLGTQRACLEAGGCLEAPDAAGFVACDKLCPPPTPPDPAAPPEPPLFLPCPMGWAEVERDGLVSCEPFPNGRPACTIGNYQPPGSASCIPLGPACAQFAADLPPGATVVYVDPAASPGGDGSRALPFDTLAAGLLAAAPGTIVALAGGLLSEPIELGDGDILWGGCPAQTRLVIGPDQVGVTLRDGQAELHGLSISGGQHSIVAAVPGSLLTLQNVWVETSSLGIAVSNGAELRAEGLVLDRAALRLDAGAKGELRGFSSRGSPQTGLRVTDAELRAFDVLIDRSSDGAIKLVGRAGLELSRAALFAQGARGLSMFTASTATISDLVLQADLLPTGIYSQGGRLFGQRISIIGSAAPIINTTLGQMRIDDLKTSDSGNELVGPGLRSSFAGPGRVQISRALIVRPSTEALRALGSECELLLNDVHVTGSSSTGAEPNRGRGLLLDDGAHVTLRRVTVEHVRTLGVEVADGSRVDGSDLRVLSILPRDELEGRGIRAAGSSSVDLDRVEVRDVYTAAIISNYDGRVSLRDVSIDGVQQGNCNCIYAQGDGFTGVVNGQISVTRFRARHVASAGARIDASAMLLLQEGSIIDAPVGVYAELPPNGYGAVMQHVLLEQVETPVLP